MNGNDEKKLTECIYPGDPRVRMLLGKQKLPKNDEQIRKSHFVYSFYINGKYMLFHTLTRKIILLSPRFIGFISDDRLFSASILKQEIPQKLYEDYFLVPEQEKESQTYLELKDLLVLKEELPQGITHYVILPTTSCNARCFYCFEQDMQYRKMSKETVEDTLAFILEHKPIDKKTIHIHWFGGEPMCAVDNIDRICTGLNEAGIEYTAEMTSNGSLFTRELAKKAADEWKIDNIQITLDGMAEEYARRKCYTSAVKNPFDTVIGNMHQLIEAGISVTMRLNVDENNLGEIYQVVDYLKEEFSEEEIKKLRVYAHSLFGQAGDCLESCPMNAGSDALEVYVQDINDYIRLKGLMDFDLGMLFTLKSHYCMVTAPECNVLIDAEGKLFACDAMTEDMYYGDVKRGIDPNKWNRIVSPCSVRPECSCCVFLPQCTEFDRCPTRTPYDDCFRQAQRRMDRDLRLVYGVFEEQKQKSTQKPDALAQEEIDAGERKEELHVSD